MIHQIEVKNIMPIKVRIVSTMSHRRDILLARAENSLWIQFYVHRNFVHKRNIMNSVSHFVNNANGIRTKRWLGSYKKGVIHQSLVHVICPCLPRSRFSWMQSPSLYWEKRHEFDPFTRWQADFIRYMFGWLTQAEENEFDLACKAVFQDMEGRSKYQSKKSTPARHFPSFSDILI